jgi:hypothetical protein
MQTEVFTGRTAAMRADNQWLGAEDIADLGDVRVEIEVCHVHRDLKFEDGREKSQAWSLKFKGKQKELLLTPTKRRPIVQAWGTDVKAWLGKEIVLFVDYSVNKPGTRGEKTWGVRVKIPDDAK